MDDNELKEKLEQKADNVKNIGCGIIAAILFILLIFYLMVLVGALF